VACSARTSTNDTTFAVRRLHRVSAHVSILGHSLQNIIMDAHHPPNVPSFEHDAVPDSATHMRLVEVLDDNYSETIQIRCRMSTWSVDTMPPYHATSYTWGDPESNATILINDQTFRVRTNCELVLEQAYVYKKGCYYWVDAICINQEDLQEKSQQVGMMGQIYKSAQHVLACVGNHADDSRFFYQELTTWAIAKRPRSHLNIIRRICLRRGIFTALRFIHAAIDFTKRPYFSRLWILHELRNAKESSILCGTDVVSKYDVYLMYLQLHSTVLVRVSPSKPLSMLITFARVLREVFHPKAAVKDWGSARRSVGTIIKITQPPL
jgi:hypothetical protein